MNRNLYLPIIILSHNYCMKKFAVTLIIFNYPNHNPTGY